MDQDWLEWFVEFIERRAKSHSHYHTENLKLSMNDQEFLLYLKTMLNITATPYVRDKVGYQLDIGNQYDLDILFSILHTNLITDMFKFEFTKIFSNKYQNLIHLYLKIVR